MRDQSFRELRTERLVLRRFAPADAPAFAAYRSDPEIARYQGWEAPFSLEEAQRSIAEMAASHPGTPGEWFQFALEERANGRLVGDCALRVSADDPTQAEVGFTLAPDAQGRGYATEAVRALLGYATERLGVRRAVAITDARNQASVAVAGRLGMHEVGRAETVFKGEPCEEITFAVDIAAG